MALLATRVWKKVCREASAVPYNVDTPAAVKRGTADSLSTMVAFKNDIRAKTALPNLGTVKLTSLSLLPFAGLDPNLQYKDYAFERDYHLDQIQQPQAEALFPARMGDAAMFVSPIQASSLCSQVWQHV